MNKNSAPSEIFTYAELKIKAQREIDRLEAAENVISEADAMDHALNAAFTVYHLREWEREAKKLTEARISPTLEVLDKIVNHMKHIHAKIGKNKPCHDEVYLLTEDERVMTKEDDTEIIIKVEIYFGDKPALNVLKDALTEFN